MGIFQRATADQLWKLTRPDNQHDKLTRDNLLDLEDHRLVRIESVREDQRQVWVLADRGHREAKQLLDASGQPATVHDLDGRRLLRTRILSGAINEYRYAA